jgi:hypothetical protein
MGKYYFLNSAKSFKKSLPILQKCNWTLFKER